MECNIMKYFAFVKAVELKNITKAAEALNYSQSGISKMITDLEMDWNCVLLERGRSGVALTSDGAKLLPYIQSLCREYSKLKQQIDDIQSLQCGLIRIASFSSVATQWLPQIIKEFQKKFSNVQFEILTGEYHEIENWILNGQVDCGFLVDTSHPDLDSIFLSEDKFLVVLPENHPMADLERFPAHALNNFNFILQCKDGKFETREFFKLYGLSPRIAFMALDDYAIMSMVEKGLGISILPELVLKRCPYRILTKELDVPASRKICLAFRKAVPLPKIVKCFLDFLPYRQ